MTENNVNNGKARLAWAIVSPFLLALAAFTFVGIFFLPVLCVYLDGRSRTYTAAACLALGAATAGYFLGTVGLAAAICVVVTTVAVYAVSMMQHRLAFSANLLISAVGGAVGMLVFAALAGKMLAEGYANIIIQGILNLGTSSPKSFGTVLMNLFALFAKDATILTDPTAMTQSLSHLPSWLAAMSLDAKIDLVRGMLLEMAAYTLPALALTAGALMGGLGFALSNRALARRAAVESGTQGSYPLFAAFYIPAYAVISIWLLQIVSSLLMTEELDSFVIVYYACNMLLNMLMTLQALALFSFLLNRKRVTGAPQGLILAGSLLFFFWMLPIVGIIDSIFSLRAFIARVDILKARGKQVFTPEGMEELRRMDEEIRRKQQKDKDGRGGDE